VFKKQNNTRSQAVARIADRTASQQTTVIIDARYHRQLFSRYWTLIEDA